MNRFEPARGLLGPMLFGAAEWRRFYKLALTPGQAAREANFPWSQSVLEERCPFTPDAQVSETHAALFFPEEAYGFSLSIRRMNGYEMAFGQGAFLVPMLLKGRPARYLTHTRPRAGWHLFPLGVAQRTSLAPFPRGRWNLTKGYRIPNAAELVIGALLVRKLGGHLFGGRMTEAWSSTRVGKRPRQQAVIVGGDSGSGSFYIGPYGMDMRSRRLGICPIRSS